MKDILLFFSFYVRVFWKNRKAAAILWLTPIFFLFLLMVMAGQLLKADSFIERFDVAIVNEDPTVETRIVIKQLTDSPELQKVMNTFLAEKEDLEGLFEKNEVAAAILIPEGFSKDVAKGINTPVTVVRNPNKPLQSQLAGYVIDSAADFTSAAQSGINTVSYYMNEEEAFTKKERKDAFKQDLAAFSLHVLGRGKLFDEIGQEHLFSLNMAFYYAVSLFVLLIMVWSFLALQLFKRKMNPSVFLRLDSYGISPFSHLAARGLAAFLLVFISAMLLVLPAIIWMKAAGPEMIIQAAVSAAIAAFVFISFFLLLEVLLVKDSLYLLAASVAILLSALLGEHFIPAIYFPDWMQRLNEFTINGWLFPAVLSYVEGGSLQGNIRVFAALVVFSILNVAFIKMASRRWRRRFS